MRPSDALRIHRDIVVAEVALARFENPRVFGSVARNDDREGSDLDLLLDVPRGVTFLDMFGLQERLEALLGVSVDIVSARGLHSSIRSDIMAQARAL